MINDKIPSNIPPKKLTSSEAPDKEASSLKEKYHSTAKKIPDIAVAETKKLQRSVKKTEKETKTARPQQAIINEQLAQIPAAHLPLAPLSLPVTSLPANTNSISQAAQPVITAMEKRRLTIAETLKQSQIAEFNEEDLAVVSSFLMHYELTDKLIENIASSETREKGLHLLQTALMHALVTATVSESMLIMRLYRDLFPPEIDKGEQTIEIKNIALVLGDAFIHDSGYEGDISPRPYADFAVELLNTSTTPYKSSEALKYILKNPIDLRGYISPLDLSLDIKKALTDCPGETQRCLLFGGWAQHAIVYEIEKKPNGRYAFRVYNEGEGILYHEHIDANHKTKYAGSIAIEDIAEDLLFQLPFLSSLQALCSSQGGEAPKLLFNTILPLLGGKEEDLAPEIQQYLSPQRSGVCTYRSLQAFLAGALPAEEYKKFKFEYKLSLLDKFLPQLDSLAKKKVHWGTYWDTVRDYALLKRCLEKFSNGIANLSSSLDRAELEKAQLKILETNFLLQKLERRLLAYEKTSLKAPPSKIAKINAVQLPYPHPDVIQEPSPTATLPSKHLSSEVKSALESIERIPANPQNPDFSKTVEASLPLLQNRAFTPEERWQLLDTFFKKIGSFEHISQLKLSQPQKALDTLHLILNQLISSSDMQEMEKYLLYYACYALYECAFRQLPESSRVLDAQFTTFLKNLDFSIFQYATCCDPFWISRFNELQDLLQKERRQVFSLPEIYKNFASKVSPFQLDVAMSKAIVSWWSDPDRPWNVELANAHELRKEHQKQIADLSAKQGQVQKEIQDLKAQILEQQKTLNESESIQKTAILKYEIAKKHSEISQLLIEKSLVKEEIFVDHEEFKAAWSDLNMPDENDLKTTVLILGKLEGKSFQSISSEKDLEFIQTLNKKETELQTLIELEKNSSVGQLKDLELKLADKQAEEEFHQFEINQIKSLENQKLTPLSISLYQDRLKQQTDAQVEIKRLKRGALGLSLTDKYLETDIKVTQKLEEIFKEKIDPPILSKDSVKINLEATDRYLFMLKSFLSQKLDGLFSSSLTPKCMGLTETQKQLNELMKQLKEPSNTRFKDHISLQIKELEARPNKLDLKAEYWPYEWENGKLSLQGMASYLFGLKPDLLQKKLNSTQEIIPSELKQLYQHALAVKHLPGKKVDLSTGIPIAMDSVYEQKTTFSPKLLIKTNVFTEPEPEDFNQYKKFASEFKKYKEKISEDLIHYEFSKIYDFDGAAALSYEEYIDFASLQQSTIQIEATLDYFAEHSDLLTKPEWVEAFHDLLFKKNLLLKELQDPTLNQKVTARFSNFFDRLMTQAERTADFNLLGNLLWTKSLVQGYIDHVNLTSSPQPPLPDLFSPTDISDSIKKILETPINSDKLSILFEACTAASSKCNLKNCNPEDLGFILLANVLKNSFPVQKNFVSLRTRDSEKAEFNIQRFFTENPHLKASDFFQPVHLQALRKLYSNIETLVQDPLQPDALVNKDQSLRICFSAGRLQSNDPTLLHRYENPLTEVQKQIFKECGLFTEVNELSMLRCSYNGQETFIKKMPDGPLFTLRRAKWSPMMILYLKIPFPDGTYHWGKWMSPGETSSYLQNNGIPAAYSCFAILSDVPATTKRIMTRDIHSGIVVCDKKTFTPRYVSIENPHIQSPTEENLLIDINTKHTLVKPSETFSNFEDMNFTAFWADDKKSLQKIDFPRFNLTFKKLQDRFECEQHPGWHLDKEQFAPHLGPTTGFMRLCRSDKKTNKIETKVLIPLLDGQEIHKDLEGKTKRALNYPYKYDFEAKKNESQLTYCEYDLVDKTLVPKNLAARYHLANIYLQKGYQDEAEALLFDPAAEVTTRTLTSQERSLLEKIVYSSQSPELSGRKVRLQLHALYLLERETQTEVSTKKKPETDTDFFSKQKAVLIREYLSRLNHIKRLDEREESLLLGSPVSSPENYDAFIHKLFSITLDPTLVGKIEKMQGLPTDEPEEKPPSFREQIQYLYARREGSFPFDYTDFRSMLDEFPKFIPLLKKECQNVKDLAVARDNGLLPLLFYLAVFKSKEISDVAKILLKEIPPLKPVETAPVDKPLVYEVKKKALPALWEASQSLNLLKDVKASDAANTYLPDLCTRYMQQKPVPEITPNFFDEDHPSAASDPAVKGEFQAVNENIRTATEMLKNEKKHVLSAENLPDLLNEVKEEQARQKQTLKTQEVFILQNITSALLSDPVSGLLFSAKKKHIPALEELCLLCARPSAEEDLKQAYPQIDAEGRKRLIGAAQEYLLQKRFVQHLDRVQVKISDIISGTKNKTLSKSGRNVMIQELGKSMGQPEPYDVHQDPLARVYLIIETTLNIKLRKEQVDNIAKFSQAVKNGQDITIQMIMGGGKTSIIQPILAFLFAQKGALSTVYVPAPLYEAVKTGLQKSLGDSFQQFVYADPFTKELSKDLTYLKNYLSRLREAKDRQAVFLLTPQHKYTLYSALKESYAEDQQERCNLLAEICQECQQTEVAQIDEIDLCLDPTVVYKFPIGKSRMIDKERAKIVSELVLELANDEAFSQKVSIDFIDAFKARRQEKYKIQGKAISETLFENEVKPLLLEKAELLLARRIPNYAQLKTQDTKGYINHFLNNSTPFDSDIQALCPPEKEDILREKIENNTQEDISSEDLPALQLIQKKWDFERERNAWIESSFGENKQLIAICTKAINSILKQSLLKECGSNYSHDPELDTKGIFTARPYLAPNSPKTSIPSDPYELAIYSMQNILFNGIPNKAIEKILGQWRKEALLAGTNFTASRGYREFQRILGNEANRFTLMEDPPQKELIDLLQNKLSKDPQAILNFMELYVFRQIVDFEKSISTTPLAGLTGFNKQRIGYTGTVNPGILPKGMEVYREPGTEGKILMVIDNKLEKDISHIYEFSPDKKGYAEQLIDKFKTEPDLYVFIDSGNWLKDVNLKIWLEKLAGSISTQRPGIQGVVYPDEKGNWLSLEKNSITGAWTPIPFQQSTLKPEQRVTLIPSKHETGTDIKQPPTARALNSVRKNMTLRDALQSVFRMRELFAGQKIDFAISKEVSEHIDPLNKEPLAADILGTYLLENQIDDSFMKNEISTLHSLLEVVEGPVRKKLTDTKLSYEQRKALFSTLENVFITKKMDDPFQEICQKKRIVYQEKGIDFYINKILDKVDFQNPLITEIFQNRELLKQNLQAAVDFKFLPKSFLISDKNEAQEIEIDIDIEKEQEQQQEQDIDIEHDIDIHTIKGFLKANTYKPLALLISEDLGYQPARLFNIPPSPVDTLLPEELKPLFKQEKYSLEFSNNLFPTTNLISEYHLPGRYLLILKNEGQIDRIVLVSHKDAELIKKGISNITQKLDPHQFMALVNLEGNVSASVPETASMHLTDPSLQRAIVQAKLLTGKVRFTEQQLDLLEESIIKAQGPQHVKSAVQLCKLYEGILSWMPDSAKLYPLTPIKTLFQKYINLI